MNLKITFYSLNIFKLQLITIAHHIPYTCPPLEYFYNFISILKQIDICNFNRSEKINFLVSFFFKISLKGLKLSIPNQSGLYAY